MKIKIKIKLINNIIILLIILLNKLKNNLVINCILNGNIEGKCIQSSLIENEISFCKDYLSDYICVPYFQNIWPEWTNKSIDEIIEKEIMKNIENEFILELTDYNRFPLPLINNIGCMHSYINLICNKNFPPCVFDSDKTLPLCKKVCTKFLNKCGTWQNLCNDYIDEDCFE